MSRKFCAVFPAGRKNRTNGLPFSYRQETLSCGPAIFNSLSTLSPRPARREKYTTYSLGQARERKAAEAAALQSFASGRQATSLPGRTEKWGGPCRPPHGEC